MPVAPFELTLKLALLPETTGAAATGLITSWAAPTLQLKAVDAVLPWPSSTCTLTVKLPTVGLVSFWGPVIGALFFILARDLLGAYTETWLLWYGMLFIVMVLFQPDGVAGAWQQGRAKLAAYRRSAAPSVAAGASIKVA